MFGKLGASLTDVGKEQARAVAKRLADIEIAAVLSSDLNRAKETAAIIAAEKNLKVLTNDTIRERYFGDDMSKVQKHEIEKGLEGLSEAEKLAFKYYPHGESGYDVIHRFEKFLCETAKAYPGKTVVVVNHAYVMRSFLMSQKFAKHDELRGGTIANGGYIVVRTDGKEFKVIKTYGIDKRRKIDNEE